MYVRDAFQLALRALGRNKMRAALTMLGIFIGVAAVIAMVAVGDGARSSVEEQINSLGTNLLIVLPGATTARLVSLATAMLVKLFFDVLVHRGECFIRLPAHR